MHALGQRQLAKRLVERQRREGKGPREGNEITPPRRPHRSRKKLSPISEWQLHVSVSEMLDWLLLPPALYTTFPAGWGKFSRALAGRLSRCGLKAGMPDILVFCNGTCLGLELKTPGGRSSPVQKDMADKLEAAGVRYVVCHSQDEVVAALIEQNIPCRAVSFTRPSYRSGPRAEICARPDSRGIENNGTETL